MASIVAKLIAAHPDEQFVFATTKRDVVAALDAIRSTVEAMGEFEQFPEGSNGVILYAMLKNAAITCPDTGDFGYIHQGCQAALSTAFEVINRETDWFPATNGSRD